MSTHATGPRSDAGKEHSSLNAVRHGLRSERPVLPGEDADAWDAFSAAVVATYAPANALERELAERIALQLWRLRRAARYEVQVATDDCEEALQSMPDTIAGLHPDDPAFHCLVEANADLARKKSDHDVGQAACEVVRRLPTMPSEALIDANVVWLLVYLLGGTAPGEPTGAATAGELRDLLADLAHTPLAETLTELAPELEAHCRRVSEGLTTAKKRFELLTIGMARQATAREHDRRLLQKSPMERLLRYEAHVSRQLDQARRMLHEVQAERLARESAAPATPPAPSAVPASAAAAVETAPAPRPEASLPAEQVAAPVRRAPAPSGSHDDVSPDMAPGDNEEFVRHMALTGHNAVPDSVSSEDRT
jgi:hypothetical protein